MDFGLGGVVVLGLYIGDIDVIGAVGFVVEFGLTQPQVGPLQIVMGI